ncbi:MAG: mechanosensitive ion channel [Synechococcus sp.]
MAVLDPGLLKPPLLVAQADPGGAIGQFFSGITSQLGTFLPNLFGALLILVVGLFVAKVASTAARQLLNRTELDDRIYRMFTGKSLESDPASEKWAGTVVFVVILVFVLVAFFNALQLSVVSQPLDDFLSVILSYLPQFLSAAGLGLLAWLLATGCKMLVTRLMQPMNLEGRLSFLGEEEEEGSSASNVISEASGTIIYWFIWLFFLPLILGVLELGGVLDPVQNLLDSVLSALPKILTAGIVLAVGWLVATLVRKILVGFLRSVGTDHIGAKVGLRETGEEGTKLSDLLGLLAFVLILIPIIVAALEEMAIEAISAPAISMLNQFMTALPQVFTAAGVLVVFFVLGRFLSEIVTDLLSGFGFDDILVWLGLSSVSSANPALPGDSAEAESAEGSPKLPMQTPSEIVGTIVLVLVMMFAAVVASEVLALANVTEVARAILRVFARILSGVLIFGVGLYLANFASTLLSSTGTGQARIMGQVAKIAIIVLVSAMALQQVGVAETIVIRAFTLFLGAFAVAVAIAFGWGGRDIAAEKIRRWWDEFDRQN